MVGADKLGFLGARERNRTASGFLTTLRRAGGIGELEEERREDTARHGVVFLVVPRSLWEATSKQHTAGGGGL
jgi:hypothetical protein